MMKQGEKTPEAHFLALFPVWTSFYSSSHWQGREPVNGERKCDFCNTTPMQILFLHHLLWEDYDKDK